MKALIFLIHSSDYHYPNLSMGGKLKENKLLRNEKQ